MRSVVISGWLQRHQRLRNVINKKEESDRLWRKSETFFGAADTQKRGPAAPKILAPVPVADFIKLFLEEI